MNVNNVNGRRHISIDYSECGSEVKARINEKMTDKTGCNPDGVVSGDAIMLGVFSEVLREIYKELNYFGID